MPPSNDLDPGGSPKQFFGAELRLRREELGMSQDEVGAAIQYDGSYVSAVERGKRFPKERKFADGCDHLFKTDGLFFRAWRMVQNTTGSPSWFAPWRDTEQEAASLRFWAPQVVPGLFQNEGYAHGLLRDEAMVSVRMERQQILTRQTPPPPSIHCVIDETVLLRPVGDKEVMKAQLLRLAEIAATPGMSVQVVPMGPHLGVLGGFVIATLHGGGSEVAYVETAVRGLTMSGRNELAAARDAWESIRDEALHRRASIDLILRTAEEKWT